MKQSQTEINHARRRLVEVRKLTKTDCPPLYWLVFHEMINARIIRLNPVILKLRKNKAITWSLRNHRKTA